MQEGRLYEYSIESFEALIDAIEALGFDRQTLATMLCGLGIVLSLIQTERLWSWMSRAESN